jgi:nucleotide-binding universal stress UspA family protein
MHRSIEAELENIREYCSQEGCVCTINIREGARREEIVAEIRENDYSLVVMGAFGQSGTSHPGSCLSEIAGEITTPLFIVR